MNIEQIVIDLHYKFKSVEQLCATHNIIVSYGNYQHAGELIRDDKESFIKINDSDTPSRQRFGLHHSLGHYFLHSGNFIEVAENYTMIENQFNCEVQANKFALCMLIPKNQILGLVHGTNMWTEDMARHFKVSTNAVVARLRMLNIVS